jgi:hypothetical protein
MSSLQHDKKTNHLLNQLELTAAGFQRRVAGHISSSSSSSRSSSRVVVVVVVVGA